MADLEERKKQFGEEWANNMPIADLFDKYVRKSTTKITLLFLIFIIFFLQMEQFKIYSQYLGNHPNAINTMESHLQANGSFVQFIEVS